MPVGLESAGVGSHAQHFLLSKLPTVRVATAIAGSKCGPFLEVDTLVKDLEHTPIIAPYRYQDVNLYFEIIIKL